LLLSICISGYFLLWGHLGRFLCRFWIDRKNRSRRGWGVLVGGQGQWGELCRQLFNEASKWLDRELVDVAIADEVV
jgi:hypothetical protein